jgi:hypothetical protein
LEHAGVQSCKSLGIEWGVARRSRGHRVSCRIEIPALVGVLLLTAVFIEIVTLITRLRQLHINLE